MTRQQTSVQLFDFFDQARGTEAASDVRTASSG
jgi:hypothetical protein